MTLNEECYIIYKAKMQPGIPYSCEELMADDGRAIHDLLFCTLKPFFLVMKERHPLLHMNEKELATETYLILRKNNWAALRNYNRESSSITNYIRTIAARHINRKSAKLRVVRLTASDATKQLFYELADEQTSALSQYKELIFDLLQHLPIHQQRLVVLLKLHGYSAKEAAERLRMPVRRVYDELEAAMNAMRERRRHV